MTEDTAVEKPSIKALNERLGITSKESLFDTREIKSVDEMLENSRREFEVFKNTIASEKERVENTEIAATNAVKSITEARNPSSDSVMSAEYAVSTFKDAIESMNSLIATGHSIINKLYDAIGSTDLVDPEVIESTAKIIESVHVNLTDIISFNTQKMMMEHNYRKDLEMEDIKHRHALEKEYFKHKLHEKEKEEEHRRKLELEKAKAIDVPSVQTVNPEEGKVSWSQTSIMDIIRNKDKVDVVEAEIVQPQTSK